MFLMLSLAATWYSVEGRRLVSRADLATGFATGNTE